MTPLAQLQINWDVFRLTNEVSDFDVLGAVLELSIATGWRNTGRIPVETLHAQAVSGQKREAMMFRKPCDPPLPISQIQAILQELVARSVITLDTPRPGSIIITPLLDSWIGLPSVRKDHHGDIVRSTL